MPPAIVVQQMVTPGIGGASLVLGWEQLSRYLTGTSLDGLADCVYPTLHGHTAVLQRGRDNAPRIRFNSYEIAVHRSHGTNWDRIESRHLTALAALEEAVASAHQTGACAVVKMQPGDLLILNNRHVLHGREALNQVDSGRLIRRAWCT
ncbi:MAG: TauD/TfdA family dioxygenase [Phycicoccus sp.]